MVQTATEVANVNDHLILSVIGSLVLDTKKNIKTCKFLIILMAALAPLIAAHLEYLILNVVPRPCSGGVAF